MLFDPYNGSLGKLLPVDSVLMILFLSTDRVRILLIEFIIFHYPLYIVASQTVIYLTAQNWLAEHVFRKPDEQPIKDFDARYEAESNTEAH